MLLTSSVAGAVFTIWPPTDRSRDQGLHGLGASLIPFEIVRRRVSTSLAQCHVKEPWRKASRGGHSPWT